MTTTSHSTRLNTRRIIIIVALIVVATALFVAGLFLFLSRVLTPVISVGDGFMGALRDEDYATAYGLLAPEVQDEIGSPEGLADVVAGVGSLPATWSYRTRSIRNNVGRLTGRFTTQDGDTGDMTLIMRPDDDGGWIITTFNLRLQ